MSLSHIKLATTSNSQKNSPLEIRQPGGIPEAFSERVAVDLEFGDELVLVSGDGGEDTLREDVGAVVLLLQIGDGAREALLETHQVDPWLVPVHRVEDNLQEKRREEK